MMKNKYIVSALALNIFTLIVASEKSVNKQEKFDQMKSLRSYLRDLEMQRIQRDSLEISGADLPHGGKYVVQDKRFGRGSSGTKANL